MLDAVFAALADPTRRAIVERLALEREVSVGELAAPFPTSLPAVIKHLDVLGAAGLVIRQRRGRRVCCRRATEPIGEARLWLDRHLAFWTARLDALSELVDGPVPPEGGLP